MLEARARDKENGKKPEFSNIIPWPTECYNEDAVPLPITPAIKIPFSSRYGPVNDITAPVLSGYKD